MTGTVFILSAAAFLLAQPPAEPVPAGEPAPPPARSTTAPATRYGLGPDGQWVVDRAPEPGSDEAIIARARKALAEDRPSDARSALDAFIDRHEKTSNVWLPQAYLYRGDAISALGNEFNALYDYETIARSFPQAPEYALAIERELEIAVRYVNGLDRKFLGVRFVDASEIGTELLIRVQERLPGSRLAERAGIELADYYYRDRDMALASEAYDLFLQNYPRSEYRMRAMQRRIYASIARYKGPRYDGKPLADAQVLIRRFMVQYPAQAQQTGLDEALLVRVDESGAQSLLQTADWYLSRSDAPSARYTLRRLIARHPQTNAAARAMDLCAARGWMDRPAPAAQPDDALAEPAPPASESPSGGAPP
jgi:hypothetical protein